MKGTVKLVSWLVAAKIGGRDRCIVVVQGPPLPGRDHRPLRVAYHRFPLSFREVEELMLQRGVVVSYETIRAWCAKFGQAYANQLRRRRPGPGDKWHLDEVFVKINGAQRHLWRAVDQHGNGLDVLVQIVTDKLASYQVAHRELVPSVAHRRSRYLNNRAKNSPSADPATRAGDETLQIDAACATVPVGVQRHLTTFSAPSALAVSHRLAPGDGRPLRGLERDHRDDRRLKVNWDRSFHQNRRTTRER